MTFAKALFSELDTKFENTINEDRDVEVQFNPETLKVTLANQIATPAATGDQKGGPSQLFVGAGTSKLTMTLWFDISSQPEDGGVTDVRKLTQKVAYFITPGPSESQKDKFVPPAVRFSWGSFQFDGIMESLEETLELFSEDGRPLRASVAVGLTRQKIQFVPPGVTSGPAAAAGAAGTRPLTQAAQGDTVQSLAARAPGGSGGGGWQDIARGNGIENPRNLVMGTAIDLARRIGQR